MADKERGATKSAANDDAQQTHALEAAKQASHRSLDVTRGPADAQR
jgi:hypothetical protein